VGAQVLINGIWYKLSRLVRGHEASHLAGEVLAVVVIGAEDAHVLMTGEPLHGPHVALCEVEGGGNGKMPAVDAAN
jgi:hypothetical protein